MTVTIDGTSGITTPTSVFTDSIGNVGVGTANPSSLLHVRKDQNTNTTLLIQNPNTGASATSLLQLVSGTKAVNLTANGAGGYFGLGGSASNITTAYFDFDAYQFRNLSGTVRLNIDSSGNLSFNSGYGSAAVAYGCRAWVNFNGTGTVAIRASGNVSSITDNGVGNYTVNITTAMPDANYAVLAIGNDSSGGYGIRIQGTPASSSVQINTTTSALVDSSVTCVAIFR